MRVTPSPPSAGASDPSTSRISSPRHRLVARGIVCCRDIDGIMPLYIVTMTPEPPHIAVALARTQRGETMTDAKRTPGAGLIERLECGPVICAEGYLFEFER